MTKYKCGIYTKTEDYKKGIVYLIVVLSISMTIILPVVFGLISYVLEPQALRLEIINEMVNNGTLTQEVGDSISSSEYWIVIPFMVLVLTILFIGIAITERICNWLGLKPLEFTTCRCCGKKVTEHEVRND